MTPTKFRSYKVSGDDLMAVLKDLKKKGPKDPNDGKRVAALTTTTLDVSAAVSSARFEGDGAITTRRDGKFEAMAKIKSMPVVYTSETLLPEIGANKLSVSAWIEWARFKLKLGIHENEHVKKVKSDAVTIVADINAMRGTGVDADKGKAAMAAAGDLQKQIVKKYNATSMAKRFNAIHKKLDKPKKRGRPGHGPVLDATVK
ncbi:DUF922 domain-containing protein [Tateyamaria armeniaca]|uniref:DUF922 domain-containing protein n=1 Tax=Tateyamaria armeniaca TaxID=2518930 RepID=A0ABW8UUC8_9RHOB